MLIQNKRFNHGGCMHEYSLQLYDNFVVKPKVFVQAIQIFACYWHLADFLNIHPLSLCPSYVTQRKIMRKNGRVKSWGKIHAC